MRGKKRSQIYNLINETYLNFAFTLAKALVILLLISLVTMSKPVTEGVKPNAQFTITVSWEDSKDWDVDEYLKLPSGQILNFNNPNIGLVNLDRDDTGSRNDTITVNGVEIENPVNQEIISIRGNVPGEYILNVHLYRYDNLNQDTSYEVGKILEEPVKVHVVIQKLNPNVEIVYSGEVSITRFSEEVPVVRFEITDTGAIGNFDTNLPVSLLKEVVSGISYVYGPGVDK